MTNQASTAAGDTRGTTTPDVDRTSRGPARRRALALAAVAVVAGVFVLIVPSVALRTLGLAFGVYLIVAGIMRIVDAHDDESLSRGRRWLQLAFGALVVVAGVLCLNNPFESSTALSVVIGLGWLVDGLAALTFALFAGRRPGRWRLGALGAVNVVVGVAFVVIPHATLSSLVIVAAVLIIVVGVTMLLVLVRWGDDDAR